MGKSAFPVIPMFDLHVNAQGLSHHSLLPSLCVTPPLR